MLIKCNLFNAFTQQISFARPPFLLHNAEMMDYQFTCLLSLEFNTERHLCPIQRKLVSSKDGIGYNLHYWLCSCLHSFVYFRFNFWNIENFIKENAKKMLVSIDMYTKLGFTQTNVICKPLLLINFKQWM